MAVNTSGSRQSSQRYRFDLKSKTLNLIHGWLVDPEDWGTWSLVRKAKLKATSWW